jgi:hypothetical protein
MKTICERITLVFPYKSVIGNQSSRSANSHQNPHQNPSVVETTERFVNLGVAVSSRYLVVHALSERWNRFFHRFPLSPTC